MFFPDLQVVLIGHLFTIPHPFAERLPRKTLLELGLPGRSQVVENSRPALEASGSNRVGHSFSDIGPGGSAECGDHKVIWRFVLRG